MIVSLHDGLASFDKLRMRGSLDGTKKNPHPELPHPELAEGRRTHTADPKIVSEARSSQ
jgi:hypothetical protein